MVALFAASLSCGPKLGPMPPVPAAVTNAELAGGLCSGALCACHEDAGPKQKVGEPAAGFKRFEVRVGPVGNELYLTVGPHTLFKSNERPTECFYVDLAPGDHQVALRAHRDPAFGAKFSISEMGVGGKHWYETFQFECGLNVCSLEDVENWIEKTRSLGELHDPCGSTKVSRVRYQTGNLPDGVHPSDLFVEAALEVYKFIPEKPPCRP